MNNTHFLQIGQKSRLLIFYTVLIYNSVALITSLVTEEWWNKRVICPKTPHHGSVLSRIVNRSYVNNALDTKHASWRVHPRCARIRNFAMEGESPWRKCRDPSWCAYLRRDTSIPERKNSGEGSRANCNGSVSQTSTDNLACYQTWY